MMGGRRGASVAAGATASAGGRCVPVAFVPVAGVLVPCVGAGALVACVVGGALASCLVAGTVTPCLVAGALVGTATGALASVLVCVFVAGAFVSCAAAVAATPQKTAAQRTRKVVIASSVPWLARSWPRMSGSRSWRRAAAHSDGGARSAPTGPA